MNIVVDGSNLSFPSVRGRRPSVRRLRTIVEAVASKLGVDLGRELVVILDSGIRYEFEDHQAADLRELQSILGPEHLVACKGRQAADEFVLLYAQEQDALIVSGDEYRDWPALREGQMRLSPVLVGAAVIVPRSVWVMAKHPRDDVEQSVEFFVRSPQPDIEIPAVAPASPDLREAPTQTPKSMQATSSGALDASARAALEQSGSVMLGVFGQVLRDRIGPEFDSMLANAVGGGKNGRLRRYVASRTWMVMTVTPSGDPFVCLSTEPLVPRVVESLGTRPRPAPQAPSTRHEAKDLRRLENGASAMESAVLRILQSKSPATIGFIGLRLPSYLGITRDDLDKQLEKVSGGARSGRLSRFVRRIRDVEIDDSTADPIVWLSGRRK